jgi:uncharacterized protein YbjT (DUF2867 family)
MSRVLVIGASGNIGRQVVSQLLATGTQVRAMSRNPNPVEKPSEIEVVPGDLTKPDTLEACLDGVDAVFLVWVAPPDTVASVIERIAKHARRIVFLSAPLKTPHPFFQQPNPIRNLHTKIEQVIEDSGLQWTVLRPGMLASNPLIWWASQIRSGATVRWPYLDVPTAPTNERDIAAVAVRALCDDGHAGKDYVITGPQSLTQREQIETIGRALNRPLQIEEISPDEARSELLAIIQPPLIINLLLDAWAAGVGLPAFMTSTVEEITGKPARTFYDWAVDHAADFRA